MLSINVGVYADVPADTLRMTTISPGGCGELVWTHETQPPYLGLMDLRENDRVEVFDQAGLVWRGRLEARAPTIQFGTGSWSLTALGYAASLRDQFYTSAKIYGGGTPVETIFTDTRDLLAPDLGTSNLLITATGRTLAGASRDLVDLTAQQIFEEARLIGTSGDDALYWHVWPGREGAGNKAVLELVPRPTVPAYTVGLSQGVVIDLEWNLQRFASRVVVKWGTGPTRTVVNNTVAQGPKPAGYGLIASRLIESNLVNNATDATNVGNTVLEAFARVKAISRSIMIPGTAIIEDAVGASVPPWRVKAGGIIRIRELRAGGIAGPDYDFLAAATSWDDRANILTITPEGQLDVAHIVARFMRDSNLV